MQGQLPWTGTSFSLPAYRFENRRVSALLGGGDNLWHTLMDVNEPGIIRHMWFTK